MSHSDLLKSNANEMDIRSYLTEDNQISIGFRIPQNPRERKEYHEQAEHQLLPDKHQRNENPPSDEGIPAHNRSLLCQLH